MKQQEQTHDIEHPLFEELHFLLEIVNNDELADKEDFARINQIQTMCN